MSEKIDINGPDAHEIYKYLRYKSELYDKDSDTA